jgi:hypothetical protein
VIGDYLAQDVWRRANTGPDGYGQPQFAAAVKTRGRWVEKRRIVRNREGREVLSEVSVTLGPDEPLSAGDQLSLDGENWLEVIVVGRPAGLGGAAVLTRAFC